MYYYKPIGMAKKKKQKNTQNRKQKIILSADKAADYEYIWMQNVIVILNKGC